MKKLVTTLSLFAAISSSSLRAQTTTFSVLSTAYDRTTGSFHSLGAVDGGWFLTEIQDLVLPLNPASLVTYPNDPTYVVPNTGNNTFTGIIADHSINYANTTASSGAKLVTYRTYFGLPNLSATTNGFSLYFKTSADDAVYTIKLNGVLKAQYLDSQFNNIPGVNKPYILQIPLCDESFRSGENHIDITIADAGSSIGFYGEVTLSKTRDTCGKKLKTGISELGRDKNFCSVYPNPAGESLFLNVDAVSLNKSNALALKIYSVDGTLIGEETVNASQLSKYKVDTSKLSAGLYYLAVIAGADTQTIKFVKE